MIKTNRRDFIKKTGTVSAIMFLAPSFISSRENDDTQVQQWLKMMKGPVYEIIKGEPGLDQGLNLFPRPQGNPGMERSQFQHVPFCCQAQFG